MVANSRKRGLSSAEDLPRRKRARNPTSRQVLALKKKMSKEVVTLSAEDQSSIARMPSFIGTSGLPVTSKPIQPMEGGGDVRDAREGPLV